MEVNYWIGLKIVYGKNNSMTEASKPFAFSMPKCFCFSVVFKNHCSLLILTIHFKHHFSNLCAKESPGQVVKYADFQAHTENAEDFKHFIFHAPNNSMKIL